MVDIRPLRGLNLEADSEQRLVRPVRIDRESLVLDP